MLMQKNKEVNTGIWAVSSAQLLQVVQTGENVLFILFIIEDDIWKFSLL